MAQLRSVTCHMGAHSVTCYLTQVNTPHFNSSHAGRYSIYLPRRDGRLSDLVDRIRGRWHKNKQGVTSLFSLTYSAFGLVIRCKNRCKNIPQYRDTGDGHSYELYLFTWELGKHLPDFQYVGHDVRPPLECSSVRRLPASPPTACLQYLIHGTFLLLNIIL